MGISYTLIGINHGTVIVTIYDYQGIIYDNLLHFLYQFFSSPRIQFILQRFIQLVIFRIGIPAVSSFGVPVAEILQRIAGSHSGPVIIVQIIISRSQFAPLIVGTSVFSCDSDADFRQVLGMRV